MKNIALAVTLVAIASTLHAQDQQALGNAVFDSAAQAYAFAISVDSPMVVRTDDLPRRYIVFRVRPSVPPAIDGGLLSINSTVGVLALYTTSGDVSAYTSLYAQHGTIVVQGKKVVDAQQPAIADAAATIADLTAKLNALLAAMRAHGLIAK